MPHNIIKIIETFEPILDVDKKETYITKNSY